jgi:hypothetical protein
MFQPTVCKARFLLTCSVITQYSDDGHCILFFSDRGHAMKMPSNFEEIDEDDVSPLHELRRLKLQ